MPWIRQCELCPPSCLTVVSQMPGQPSYYCFAGALMRFWCSPSSPQTFSSLCSFNAMHLPAKSDYAPSDAGSVWSINYTNNTRNARLVLSQVTCELFMLLIRYWFSDGFQTTCTIASMAIWLWLRTLLPVSSSGTV